MLICKRLVSSRQLQDCYDGFSAAGTSNHGHLPSKHKTGSCSHQWASMHFRHLLSTYRGCISSCVKGIRRLSANGPSIIQRLPFPSNSGRASGSPCPATEGQQGGQAILETAILYMIIGGWVLSICFPIVSAITDPVHDVVDALEGSPSIPGPPSEGTPTPEEPTSTPTPSPTPTPTPTPIPTPSGMCAGMEITILGTNGADVLNGTSGDDVIDALAGDDIINGGSGNDVICGGSGDDTIDGGNGKDTMYGQGGNDIIRGQNGQDVLIYGGEGNDIIYGGNGKDTLDGEAGDDDLYGNNGKDTLDGGSGYDMLDGGNGKDTCENGENLISCEN